MIPLIDFSMNKLVPVSSIYGRCEIFHHLFPSSPPPASLSPSPHSFLLFLLFIRLFLFSLSSSRSTSTASSSSSLSISRLQFAFRSRLLGLINYCKQAEVLLR